MLEHLPIGLGFLGEGQGIGTRGRREAVEDDRL